MLFVGVRNYIKTPKNPGREAKAIPKIRHRGPAENKRWKKGGGVKKRNEWVPRRSQRL